MASKSTTVKVDIVGDATSVKKATKEAEGSLGSLGTKFPLLQSAADKLEQKFPAVGKVFDKFGASAKGAGEEAEGGMSLAAGATAAGVAAIGAVAVEGVMHFEKLAQSVLAFQRVSGLTAQQSSQWVAALHEYNISADEGAGLVGKFEKAIANTPEKLKQFGVEVVHAKDGTVDMNATMINAVNAFSAQNDETKKAAMGTALFGKSWQTLLPILDEGGQKLKETFANVPKGNILSQKDVDQGEQLRLTFKKLGESVAAFANSIGKALVPVLNGLAPILGVVGKGLEVVGKVLGTVTNDLFGHSSALEKAIAKGKEMQAAQMGVSDALKHVKEDGDTVVGLTGDLTDVTKAQTDAAKDQAKAADDAAQAFKDQTKAIEDQNTKMQDGFGSEKTYLQAQRDLIDAQKEVADKTKAATDAKGQDLAKNLDASIAEADLKDKIKLTAQAYAEQQGATKGSQQYTDEMVTSLVGLEKEFPALKGIIEDYIRTLQSIPDKITTTITTVNPDGSLHVVKGRAAATGSPARAGEALVVGDGGRPEVFVPDTNGNVIPLTRGPVTAAAQRSGGDVNVYVTNPVPSAHDVGREVAWALKAAGR